VIIDTTRLPARMRAIGGSLAAGRDVWRDSGAVSTQVAVAQSDYGIEVRDTHLRAHSSAPIGRTASRIAGRAVFGDAWQGYHHGYAVWSVVRAGAEIHRRVGVLNFQYLLQNTDQVRAQFVDRSGNEGGWVTHTASAVGAIDHHQYVDAVNGDDLNDGLTRGFAVATAYQARLNMEAVLLANEVGAIHFARDQVHTYTSSTLPWQGHVAGIRRRVIFDGFDPGADPIIRGDGTAASAFTYGNLDSIELNGLRLEGQRIVDVGSTGVSCLRTAGTRGPQDLLIRNCTITDYRACVVIEDANMTNAQRLAGGGDFVCFWNTSLLNAGSAHIFDSLGSRYVSITDCTIQTQFGESGENTTRVSNWLHYVLHNTTWDPDNGGSMRLQCGRDTTVGKDIGESGYASISDCTFVGTDRQFNAWGFGRPAPDDTSEGWLHDVRMINLRTEDCRFALGVGTFGQTAGNNQYDRIQLWSCTIGGPIDLMGGPASGSLNSIDIIDCTTVMSGVLVGEAYEGPAPAVRLYGREAARYASGSVKIRGLRAQWPAESAGFHRVIFNAPRLTQAELIPIIDSDYIHASNVGAPAPTWVDGGLNLLPEFTRQYELTLAQWQTATTNDASSTTRGSSDLNVVSLGTHALNQSDMDARYASAGGVVDNLGWPRVHALDAARKIRFATPDPGPFEFGATSAPDGPPGVNLIRDASLALRGAGLLDASASASSSVTASLTLRGAGQLDAEADLLIAASLALRGAGQLDAEADLLIAASLALRGAGQLDVSTSSSVAASLALRGAGEAYLFALALVRGELEMRGAGRLLGEAGLGGGAALIALRLLGGGALTSRAESYLSASLLESAIARIQSAFLAGLYFPAHFSSGKLMVDYSKPQKPQVKCEEVSLADEPDLGRGFGNTQSKRLACVVSFPRQVVFDIAERAFEQIPLIETQLGGTVGIRLLSAEYTYPPEKDPSGQCKAEYRFEIACRWPVSFFTPAKSKPHAPLFASPFSLKEKVQNRIADTVSLVSGLPVSVQEESCEWEEVGRRSYSISRSSWSWRCVVQSASKATFGALEAALSYRTITLPADPEQNTAAVFVRLASIQYAHPPQQDSNRGSVVVVTFQATTRN
jgi:hypothetical protein